ncbi:MAG: RnfABCDGE type electron transport complex subunit G [Clostridia bacterium]|nr:RnfABCDGE type electron transport complex subunit G [Clostridia bacterium]
MKIKFKDILVPTVTLFVICLVVSALLAGTNALTKEPIAQNELKKSQEAMHSVCPDAVSFEGEKGIEIEVYKALNESNEVIGYAIPVSAKGYGGDVSVMVGISSVDGGMVTGVEILSHSETPGLGANATSEDFRNQFKDNPSLHGFSVVKDGTGGSEGKIDAITGATITSNAVTNAVNEALNIYYSLNEGGEL